MGYPPVRSRHSPFKLSSSKTIPIWEKGLQSRTTHPPLPPPAPQFPGHLDSSNMTAGPRSTFSGARILPPSQTDPLWKEMEKEAETAQNPTKGPKERLRGNKA